MFEVTYVAEGILDYLVSEYDLEIEAYNATIKSLTTQITECDNEIAEYDTRIIELEEAIKDKDVAMVISAEIICNGKNITDFGEGKVMVQIPFEPATGTKGSDYQIIYVADDGTLENIPTSYKDGFLIAELEHFSEYVIVNTATQNSANTPAGNTGVLWLCVGLMGIMAAALGGIIVTSGRKVMR